MRNYRELVKDTIKNPEDAEEYLRVSLEEYEADGELYAFLKALRTVAEVHGGIQALSEKTGLNRQHLYRSLSPSGNPTIKTLDSILRALGLKLTLKAAS